MLAVELDIDAQQDGPQTLSATGDECGADRLLPARAYHGLPFQKWEDAAIWTRAWVGIGFEAEVAQVGDVLPFTVGNHGIHVERMPDGALAGRFNKAQHGGCRTVPLQCQTGARTRCSFTACGYSYDRRPIAARDPNRARHLDQYLGLRPERLLQVPIRAWGPVLLARLDPNRPAQLDWPAPDTLISARDDAVGETIWQEVDANWKHVAVALATGADDETCTSLFFPNVIVRADVEETCVILLQPVALKRTLLRIRTTRSLMPDWIAHRAAQATRMQEGQPLGETPHAQSVRDALETRVRQAVGKLALEQRSDVLFRTDDRGDW